MRKAPSSPSNSAWTRCSIAWTASARPYWAFPSSAQQCHSHKFDPISQDEYYGIFAFFNNAYEAQSWVYTAEQQKQIAAIQASVKAAEHRLKKQRPQWQQEMAGLGRNRPGPAGHVVPAQGHGTRKHQRAESSHTGSRSLDPHSRASHHERRHLRRLRVGLKASPDCGSRRSTHRDLPFDGPGRSKYGTWAVSEMASADQLPDSEKWEKLKLVNATADFSEPDGGSRRSGRRTFDKDQNRVRGPVAY